MPELPEVETTRLGILPLVVGKKILSAELFLPRLLVYPPKSVFLKSLFHNVVINIRRQGKYLLFELKNSKVLVIHLGMSGRLTLLPHEMPYPPHTHFLIRFSKESLCFVDPRTFGKLALLNSNDFSRFPGLSHLGMDAISEKLRLSHLSLILQSNRRIKALLLDQTKIAGIGNIYADEILFACHLHPRKVSSKLKLKQVKLLHQEMKRILNKSIRYGGTTIMTFMQPNLKFGKYQKYLQVYGKEKEPCLRCKVLIKRLVVAGRSTFICPNCQKI